MDKKRKNQLLLALFLFVIGFSTFTPLHSQDITSVGDDPGLKHLGGEIARLAKIAGGVVGVGVIHIDTNRELYLNKEVPFPMASTYKVPIAVQILSLVEDGTFSLDDMIPIKETDCMGGMGTISEWLRPPGVSISVNNLLDLMLIISDNSATDVNFGLAGGGEDITARMRKIGIQDITVSRPTWLLIGEWLGLKFSSSQKYTPDEMDKMFRSSTPEERQKANEAFNKSTKDTSSPAAMAALLKKIWKGEILTKEHTELLIGIMKRCDTGKQRLRGLLPPGTVVPHKTGTIGQTLNDVGYIILPGDAGTVVTVVYIKESEKEEPVREKAIAQIARAVHDYFVFNPGEK